VTPARRLAAIAAALMLALPGGAGAQSVGGESADRVVATYGDWNIRCATDNDVCVMHQVGTGSSGNNVLEVRIRKLEGVTADNGRTVPAAIQIAAPLGVLLQQGVRISVDGGNATALPFQLCVQGGCIARSGLTDAQIAQMKAGQTATFTLAAPNAGAVPVEISLTGFTRSFNELKP
jgi:invasion protein IalB